MIESSHFGRVTLFRRGRTPAPERQAGDVVGLPSSRSERGAATAPQPAASLSGIGAFDARPVLFVSADRSPMVRCMVFLAAAGMNTAHRSPAELGLDELRSMAGRWAMIVIDLDSFPGGVPVVEPLTELRRAAPDTVVVLCGSSVGGDGSPARRLPVADATIRKPLDLENFEAGVIAALDNNRRWRRAVRLEAAVRRARQAAARALPQPASAPGALFQETGA